jgi:hypothetical protein
MVTLCDDEAENRGCGVTSHGARHIGNGQGVQRRDSHYQQSHLCRRNMTLARTANNARCSRLRGFKVPAVVIDAPLSAHGCVRHANKLPDARGAGTHAASRGLVRSCRPRNRCRPSRLPRAAFTAVMACRGRCRATGDACSFHHAGRRSVYSSLLKATAGSGVYTLVVSRNPDTVVGRHWSRGNPTGA